jgi:hypothetical protein
MRGVVGFLESADSGSALVKAGCNKKIANGFLFLHFDG